MYKSCFFSFLSTFITAILTHHLGWIRTVIPESDYKLVTKFKFKKSYFKSHVSLIIS